jgi:uncharacterized DUF497 family protein
VGFEWDPLKALANLAKHGSYFAELLRCSEDDSGVTIRGPISEEERWITLGCDAIGRVLVVAMPGVVKMCA